MYKAAALMTRLKKTGLLIFIVITTLSLGGCSWIPFFDREPASCLDDDSCDDPSALSDQASNQTWYCYGVGRDDPWDCKTEQDDASIRAINPERAQVAYAAPTQQELQSLQSLQSNRFDEIPERAEIQVEDYISTEGEGQGSSEAAETDAGAANEQFSPSAIPADSARSAQREREDVLEHPIFKMDSGYAVQLIALQSVEAVEAYAMDHNIAEPDYVRIRSQNQDWYVLLLGLYSDRTGAQSAADEWESIYQPYSKPWVRPITPLKTAVREALDTTP